MNPQPSAVQSDAQATEPTSRRLTLQQITETPKPEALYGEGQVV